MVTKSSIKSENEKEVIFNGTPIEFEEMAEAIDLVMNVIRIDTDPDIISNLAYLSKSLKG